jgi:hypothetical protein
MEEIVIRHGCYEGPRSPSLADVERALADIESGRDQRDEFSIQYVSNWKRDVVDGRPVLHMVLRGRYITVARFYPDDKVVSGGWFVLFREGEEGYALALDERRDAPFVEGICCGGPLTVRANCIVPTARVLAAVGPYLRRRERCPVSNWLPESQVYHFE